MGGMILEKARSHVACRVVEYKICVSGTLGDYTKTTLGNTTANVKVEVKAVNVILHTTLVCFKFRGAPYMIVYR